MLHGGPVDMALGVSRELRIAIAMQRLLLIIIGGIAAMGQAAILFHALADCYPYKVMSEPPAEFYGLIARVGVVIAPVASTLAAWWLCKKATSALPSVATLLCPGAYLLVFVGAHIVVSADMGSTTNFDQTTPMSVVYDFAERAGWLSAAGVGGGGLCGLVIKALFNIRARDAQISR
jgi:hypothetical protein